MTNKERIIHTLKFEPTDRTPFTVLNGQMWICARNGLSVSQMLDLPDAGAKMLFDAYNEIGSEILTSGCAAAWPMIEVMGGTISMDGIAAEITKRPLTSLADIQNYDSADVIAKIRADHYYQRTLVQMREMRKLAGDDYMIGGGFFGPFTLAAQMLGLDDFMCELYEDEDGYVDQLLDLASDIYVAYIEDLVKEGLDLVTIPEPTASGDLISPAMFEEFVLPIDIKTKARIEKLCPYTLVHICGKTDKLVKVIAENGFNIFSVDSIDLVDAQHDSDKRCAMFGNLNPAHILASKTADEVYAISKALIAQMKPFGGFILAPGCDLAPTIPLENLQAMAKAAQDS